jgi:hypothetical protein
MANGAVTQQGSIAIGQRALAAYVGTNVNSQGAIAIGQNAGAAYLGTNGSNISTANFIGIGLNAGAAWAPTGLNSSLLAIGKNAAQNYSGGSATNSRIIAIGENALSGPATSGESRNVAIGHRAGTAVTTGSDNVMILTIGNTELTTGQANTFINQIGNGINTGNQNTLIGFSPRIFPNTGNSTMIGAGSEAAFNVGISTTSIGSLANRATGNFNTAIGFGALRTVGALSAPNSADTSTAIGYEAGAAGTNQTMNRQKGTYIGFRAGYAGVNFVTATGRELIAIGLESALTQTAGDHNTAIGRVNLANTTGSNQLAIGGNGIGWIRQDVDGSLRRTLLNATTSDVTTFTTSAALEINGTNGAVLLPRLTTAQRDALTPTDGMQIYNTTTNKFQGRAGGAWVDLH